MKRVVQYSMDIFIRNEAENEIDNEIDLEKLIAEVLEEKGLCVCGVGFTGDLTEVYEKDYPDYLKGIIELEES